MTVIQKIFIRGVSPHKDGDTAKVRRSYRGDSTRVRQSYGDTANVPQEVSDDTTRGSRRYDKR